MLKIYFFLKQNLVSRITSDGVDIKKYVSLVLFLLSFSDQEFRFPLYFKQEGDRI